MNLTTLKPFLFAILFLTFLTACDKDSDEPEPEATETEKLTAGPWKGDRILVAGTDASAYPGAAGLVPDPKSITITFNADGTYSAVYTLNGQTVPASGQWEFTADEKKLIGNFFGFSSEADVAVLNETSLVLKTSVDVPDFPFPVPVEMQFVR
ncbi:hypothetical protein ACXYMU_09000 [Pontibacter sp. CAU 1760]